MRERIRIRTRRGEKKKTRRGKRIRRERARTEAKRGENEITRRCQRIRREKRRLGTAWRGEAASRW